MKITTLALFALILTCSYLQAQTTKGNMMVGGTLSFTKETPQDDGDTQYSSAVFYPSFGYFVSDNLAVGASLAIVSETSKNTNSKDVYSAFGFGPFARYYKFTSNENFAFFGQAQLLFVSGSEKDTQINTPTTAVKNSQTSF